MHAVSLLLASTVACLCLHHAASVVLTAETVTLQVGELAERVLRESQITFVYYFNKTEDGQVGLCVATYS